MTKVYTLRIETLKKTIVIMKPRCTLNTLINEYRYVILNRRNILCEVGASV